MKRSLLANLLFGVLMISGALPPCLAAMAPPGKTIAVAVISDKTKLVKAELLGKYIFVHDNERMDKGEPCLYVYRYSEDATGQLEIRSENLVVSFHCQPVERPKATQLVLTYGVTGGDSYELREIQFAGSLEGHRVP